MRLLGAPCGRQLGRNERTRRRRSIASVHVSSRQLLTPGLMPAGSPSPAKSTLSPLLTPHGHLLLAPADDETPLPAELETRLTGRFALGAGHGLLQLGAAHRDGPERRAGQAVRGRQEACPREDGGGQKARARQARRGQEGSIRKGGSDEEGRTCRSCREEEGFPSEGRREPEAAGAFWSLGQVPANAERRPRNIPTRRSIRIKRCSSSRLMAMSIWCPWSKRQTIFSSRP